MSRKEESRSGILWVILIFALMFVLSFSRILYSFDKLITDPLYQRPSVPDNRIRILAIDEKTQDLYGEYADWQRGIYADLLDKLYADPDQAPAVVGFDIIFASERSPEEDMRFAKSAEGRNVVTAVNLQYRDEVALEGGKLMVERDAVSGVVYPYDALRQNVTYGFANTYLDQDQFVRFAGLTADYKGETLPSLSLAVYRAYAKTAGEEIKLPETDEEGLFSCRYTGRSGSYEVVSLSDVLEGNVPAGAFSGCIVLVGAYAPGMRDSYNAAISHGQQMYGVEIQANILEAMMEEQTALPVSHILYALVCAVICALYYLIMRKRRVPAAAVIGVLFIAAILGAGVFLFQKGYVVQVVEPILGIAVIFAVHLAAGYIAELLKKRKILSAFKQYVAPQVVDEVAGKGNYSIRLGGERRDIAVLFVDIRGFTPMSEGLEPEQVVEILNEYLTLTTHSIFQNKGTLDKFIGDATMAVFNSPFELDDYIYRAVCTARDIAAGSEALEKKLMERFGRSVSFGIGVNCGPAVVGNIGCDFRMDYTAIGDTVNTAARLESNAGRGQILISDSVYEALKERIRVTPVGAIPLKGKSKEIFVYQLDEVL